MFIIKKTDLKGDIIGLIFVIALAAISTYYAFFVEGGNAGKLTLASSLFILFLVLKDFKYKLDLRKEEEEATHTGKMVMSLSKSSETRSNIGNIAHQSTKNKDLKSNQKKADQDNNKSTKN